MRLSEQAKSHGRLRTRSQDMLGEQQSESNPIAELQFLFTPEVKERIEDPSQILSGEHRTQYAIAYILQQAIPDLDFSRLEETTRAQLSTSLVFGSMIAAELQKDTFDPALIRILALDVSCAPERRSTVVIPDNVFNHWLQLLDQRDRSGDQSAFLVAQTLFDLLVLRPDKQADLQDYLHSHGWDEVLWRGKRIEVSAHALATAQVRVIEPRYSLTLQERKAYLREYAEAQQTPILAPSITGWAALAILLSPEVEMNSQGRVVLKNQKQAVDQLRPLPPRIVV
ncbi:MAG: hypothetical protein AAB558_00700 [Patescibacteria group bacterium]